jgi:hypothetical protein
LDAWMPGFSGGLERLSACPTGARNHNYARLVLPGVKNAWACGGYSPNASLMAGY